MFEKQKFILDSLEDLITVVDEGESFNYIFSLVLHFRNLIVESMIAIGVKLL